ncbi:uncharacterized protein LOC116177380 [Photinus pyralis]|nr:uncharacterized protein LOC116177380 [Photinus pyralis]
MSVSKIIEKRRQSLKAGLRLRLRSRAVRNLQECFEEASRPVNCSRKTRSKVRLKTNPENKTKSHGISKVKFTLAGGAEDLRRTRRTIRPPLKFMDLSFKSYRPKPLPPPSSPETKNKRQKLANVKQERPESRVVTPRTPLAVENLSYYSCVHTIINNKTLPITWYSTPTPTVGKFANPVEVFYTLKDIPAHGFTVSCGYMVISPDIEILEFPRSEVTMFKIENGKAIVKQQLKEVQMEKLFCFYVPLGSAYYIKNISCSKPLVLFFSKLTSQ